MLSHSSIMYFFFQKLLDFTCIYLFMVYASVAMNNIYLLDFLYSSFSYGVRNMVVFLALYFSRVIRFIHSKFNDGKSGK